MLAGVPARDRADDLAANSTLIDKGTNVGLPYRRNAPDLGAFESS